MEKGKKSRNKRVLSGMRATGKLHIGNLFGALENWKKLQDEYECFFFVADWHALTTNYENSKNLRPFTQDIVIDWLTAGIDPEKAVLFVQSDIKEHAELHLIFSMLVTLSRLLRNPTFKEYIQDMKTQELRSSGKRYLEDAAIAASGVGLEFLEEKNWKITSQDDKSVLKARMKEAVFDSLVKSKGEEVELPYGSLVSYGFLGYPVLQAADILIYRPGFVPVGEDQLPHLELTREIARKFNSTYKEVFPVPEPILTRFPRIPGTDNRKMSKSYKNTILISDSPDMIREKVSKMYTDPSKIRRNDPGHPEECPVYAFHEIFNPEGAPDVKEECKKGLRGCVACKKEVSLKMVEFLAPYRKKRENLERNPKKVREILEEGAEKARREARDTMEKVREAMKFWNTK